MNNNFENLFNSFSKSISDLEIQFKLILDGITIVSKERINEFKTLDYQRVNDYINQNKIASPNINSMIENLPDDIIEILKKIIEFSFHIADVPIFLQKQQIISYYAYFEGFLKDCIKLVYSNHPEILSDKEIKMSNVLKSKSIQEIIEKKIEQEMRKIRGGIVEIFNEVIKITGLDYQITKDQRKILFKYIDIRNLLIHNNGIMDEEFYNKYSEFHILPVDSEIKKLLKIDYLPISKGMGISLDSAHIFEFSKIILQIGQDLTSLLNKKFD